MHLFSCNGLKLNHSYTKPAFDMVLKNNKIFIWIAYTLLGFPLFYFAYKFGLPDFGGQDYRSYQLLYAHWDFAKVDCPFNMRLIGSFFIYLMNTMGFNYDTETVFHLVHPKYDQQVYFNAVFFNFICVVITCYVIYRTVLLISKNELYSFFAGTIYLLGFGTLFFSLKPTSEACGILLAAWAFYYYIQQKRLVHLILFLSLFQREYMFIVFGIMAGMDFFFTRKRYYAEVLVSSVLFFVVYYILRKTLFFTPTWDFQTSPSSLIALIFDSEIEAVSFIKQTIFISNIFWIYVFVVAYKRLNKLEYDKHFLITILIILIQVILMSIITKFGNNAGRYFYYTSPIVIYYLFVELMPLFSQHVNFKKHV